MDSQYKMPPREYVNKIVEFIKKIAEIGRFKEKYLNIMLRDENIKYYCIAFTHKTYNKNVNYEIFEQLGDLSINKFLVWHAYRKFPQINFSDGHAIAARIRITFGSNEKLNIIGEKLGLRSLLLFSAADAQHGIPLESLTEDVFESFIGATEFIFDRCLIRHCGYSFVYNILEGIFDNPHYVTDFKLDYNILMDPVTRLKELTETPQFKNIYPNQVLEYVNIPVKKYGKNLIQTKVNLKSNDQDGPKILIGEGTAIVKGKSRPIAALMALNMFESRGLKQIGDKYENLIEANAGNLEFIIG
jgi:dsRNA-specific ribonuclease